MRKKIKSFLLVVVIIVLSVFYAHIDKNTYIYDRNAETDFFYGTGVLETGDELTQSFIVEEDTISGVNIKISYSGDVSNVVLKYIVLDETMNEVSNGAISATKLENNKFNKLKFSEINNTKGKCYTLVLSQEGSDDLNGIGFFIEPHVYQAQQLTVRGGVVEGTLVTRIVSQGFDLETFIVLLGMVAFIIMFMKVLYKYFK